MIQEHNLNKIHIYLCYSYYHIIVILMVIVIIIAIIKLVLKIAENESFDEFSEPFDFFI